MEKTVSHENSLTNNYYCSCYTATITFAVRNHILIRTLELLYNEDVHIAPIGHKCYYR